nr:hypothetical protein [Brevundimonas diminuta]
MTPVDLNLQRWFRLIAEAHMAVESGDVRSLEKRATAMREAPSPAEGAGRAACNTFRWACLWFVHADASHRAGLAPTLLTIAAQVERELTPPEPDPVAVAAACAQAVGHGEPDLFDPAWSRRADIGG